MQVTNVRVSFLREKQPAQYEKAAPAVEFNAVLDDGEDHVVAALKLMTDATAVVYAGIGYDVPPKVAAALSSGKIPGAIAVETTTKETPVEAPTGGEGEPTESTPEGEEKPAEKPAPKKRGRPKGSTNTRPKAGTKAAEKAAAAKSKTTAADVPDDDIPGGDAPRVGPDDDPADHGEPEKKLESKDKAPAKEFTAKDLHTMIIDLINEKKLSVPSAKQLLAHFKVARAQDLTAKQVAEGKDMIEKMVAASEKKS